MKSHKKNRSVATHKTELSVEEGLAILGDIHKRLEEVNLLMDKLGEGDSLEQFLTAKKEFDTLCQRFDYFLSHLPPVKFDDREGEYFVAQDQESGSEIFRVVVTRTYRGVLDIPASTEGAAKLAAMQAYGERKIDMRKVGKQPTVEVVGVPVERLGK